MYVKYRLLLQLDQKKPTLKLAKMIFYQRNSRSYVGGQLCILPHHMEISIERSPKRLCPNEGSNSELFDHENQLLRCLLKAHNHLIWPKFKYVNLHDQLNIFYPNINLKEVSLRNFLILEISAV